MRNLRSITALLLLISFSCFAQNTKSAKDTGSVEQQIQNVLEQRRQAALKADVAFIDANTADDYVRISPNGQLMTKAELVAAMKNGSIKYQSIEQKDLKIQVYGSTAVTTSVADLKGINQGQDVSGAYRVSQVYVKRAGKWIAVHFHASPMK